jgi:uncharacterized membrane protein YiaA
MTQKPSFAFIAASWVAFGTGLIGYFTGVFGNKELQLSDKGYYFTVIMFALFAVISVQKSVRDRLEGILCFLVRTLPFWSNSRSEKYPRLDF